jgi:hypothetical protein
LKKQDQLDGFYSCLDLFIVKSFPKLLNKDNINKQSLEKYFAGVHLVDYPKKFKFLLTYNFSIYQDQELPQGPVEWREDIKSFFCNSARNCFFARARTNKQLVRRDIMFWNLLQCKSLSNTVPSEFILQGYEKHRKAMSTPSSKVLDEPFLEELKNFVRPWAKRTVQLYKDKTLYPSNHACYENKRDAGGQRGVLQQRKQIVTRSFINDYSNLRVEPVVIHITGPPGTGKSRSVEQICKALVRKFGYNQETWKSLVYYRSAATDHWDGYRQQMITVLDDFGYATPKEDDNRKELLQLVSDCEYILPMAELREKGRKFTSKFIIVTSNTLASSLHDKGWSCPDAFFRRLSPCYHLTSNGYARTEYTWDQDYLLGSLNPPKIQSGWQRPSVITGPLPVQKIVDEAFEKFLRFTSCESRKTWYQEIIPSNSELPGLGLEYSLEELPSNLVKVYAIAEPLKVRTITKPMANSFALKPCQLAMFEALKDYKCFEPNSNPNYNLDQLGKPDEGKVLLSGDYTAATDEIDIKVSQTILEVLASCFDEVSLSRVSQYIRWEMSQHGVEYPPWTKLDPVLQENGQLMGSLLSFPVLCLANAFTVCRATKKGLDEVPALFHGDDVAAQLSLDEISLWKQEADHIGLQLSVGKNYISKRFVSIDSQLFCLIDGVLTRQVTGKFKLVKRNENDEITVADALRSGFTKDQIKRYSAAQLSHSCRSIDVSYKQGGLGLEGPTEGLSDKDKAIYLAMLRSKTSISKIAANTYRVPKLVQKFLRIEEVPAGTFIDDEDKVISFETKLKTKVKKILNSLKVNKRWSEHRKNFHVQFQKMDTSTDLSALHSAVIRYDDSKCEELGLITKSLLPASMRIFLPTNLSKKQPISINEPFRRALMRRQPVKGVSKLTLNYQ